MTTLNRKEAIKKAGKIFIDILDEKLNKKLIESPDFSEWSSSILDFKNRRLISAFYSKTNDSEITVTYSIY